MIEPCDVTADQCDRDEHFIDAVLAFERSVEAGRPLPIAELGALFPDLAEDDLREIVSGHAQMGQWVGEMLEAPTVDYPPDGDFADEDLDTSDSDIEALRAELGTSGALERLRGGGIGAIYRCEDPEFGRELAVKVLRPKYRGRADLERRLIEEAQIGARLEHPGVVRVHDLGRLPDGRPYFTMKLVRGPTLEELLKQRTDVYQDRPRFIKVFEQVCQTLAFAQSKNVIHLDLKPANVMVGEFGEVQVIDWGFAEVVTAGAARTLGGGTWAYMAPEHARCEVDNLSARSDVFGLGAILCHILTGGPPYQAPTASEVSEQARTGDLDDALVRLSRCAAGPELLALTGRCLCVDVADRPTDARAVADAVAAYQARIEERRQAAERQRAAAEARAEEEAKTRQVAEAKISVERRARKLARTSTVLLLIAVGALVTAVVAVTREQVETARGLYARSIPEVARALDDGSPDRAGKILEASPKQLRNLEWYLLWRASQPDARSLGGHNAAVVTADLASDGTIATADRHGAVRLWDKRSNGPGRGLRRRVETAVTSLVSGNDGAYLAAAGDDGLVHIWDVAKPDCPLIFEYDAGSIIALARTAPTMAAAARGGSEVKIWDRPTGLPIHTVRYPGKVECLALTPDGKYLAIGSMDFALKIWDLTDTRPREFESLRRDPRTTAFPRPYYRVAWGGPAGRHLIATGNGAALVWNMLRDTEAYLPGYDGQAMDLAFDRKGGHLAAGFATGIRVWSFQGSELELVFARRHPRIVNHVSLDAEGHQAAYATPDEVAVESWRDVGGTWRVRGHRFAFSPDGRLVAVASGNGEHPSIVLLDSVERGQVGPTLRGHTDTVTALAFSPDSDRLVTASSDRTVRVWDVRTGRELVARRRRHDGAVLCVVYSVFGDLVASSTERGTVRVWDEAADRISFEPFACAGAVTCLAFSPDGRHLAAACRDWTVTVWDLATREAKARLTQHRLGVNGVMFSADGRRLVSAGEDGTVRFWDVDSEFRSGQLLRHNVGVMSVALSPDGSRVVSVGRDGRVRIWETATGQKLVALNRRTEGARSPGAQVGLNPISNRKQLATAYEDGVIEIWNGEP